nr:MAG TPA: hypothetical protein [Caudoviricetes sp.]
MVVNKSKRGLRDFYLDWLKVLVEFRDNICIYITGVF